MKKIFSFLMLLCTLSTGVKANVLNNEPMQSQQAEFSNPFTTSDIKAGGTEKLYKYYLGKDLEEALTLDDFTTTTTPFDIHTKYKLSKKSDDRDLDVVLIYPKEWGRWYVQDPSLKAGISNGFFKGDEMSVFYPNLENAQDYCCNYISNISLPDECNLTFEVTITAESENLSMGDVKNQYGEYESVSTTHSYWAGESVKFTAYSELGYLFDRWNDKSTDNPCTFEATKDSTITAYFKPFPSGFYEIRAYANPTGSCGTVTGGGDREKGQTYKEGETVTLTAKPGAGYHFVKWSDGTTANPYVFRATKHMEVYTTFEEGTAPSVTYTITATSSNTTMGTVSGGGTYEEGKTVTLTATPKSGYKFVKWSDGTTVNPYTFKATKNVTLTATFEKTAPTTYTITATSANTTMGTVSGGGTYEEGKSVTLTATPKSGYKFVKWSDGSTANPYTFKATKDVTLTANFEKIPVKSDVLKADDVKANKCYIIYTEERGGLTVTSESDTRIWGTGESGVSQEVDAKNELQHFAFVKESGNLYLYSVAAGKFVSATLRGELTEKPSAPISFVDADAETVRLVFDADYNVNLGGSKQVVIDNWTTKDAGNSFLIMEAGDFSGVVTGLATIVTDNAVTPMYDLQGRMVIRWPGRRGVSIVNGRKIIK